jgi:hypothetical protein
LIVIEGPIVAGDFVVAVTCRGGTADIPVGAGACGVGVGFGVPVSSRLFHIFGLPPFLNAVVNRRAVHMEGQLLYLFQTRAAARKSA